MTNVMIGFWLLMPYLVDTSLFIENKEEVLLQQIETEVNNISDITPEVLLPNTKNQWYHLVEQLPTTNRRLDSGY
jgi:hypothetical protein